MTMITPSYLGETIEYSSLHACRSTLEDPTFEQSQHVAFARDGDHVVAMARMLSDGVCNAYVVDVWTHSAYRRQGIAATLMRMLADAVPGQHIGRQTDDAQAFYSSLGYREQPEFWSLVVGQWLDNEANR